MKKLLILLICPIAAQAYQNAAVVMFSGFPAGTKYINHPIKTIDNQPGTKNFSEVNARYPTLMPPRNPLGSVADNYDLECSGLPPTHDDDPIYAVECTKEFSTDINWYSGKTPKTCTFNMTLKLANDHAVTTYSTTGECTTKTGDYLAVSPL